MAASSQEQAAHRHTPQTHNHQVQARKRWAQAEEPDLNVLEKADVARL
jgi:hypothetical protein